MYYIINNKTTINAFYLFIDTLQDTVKNQTTMYLDVIKSNKAVIYITIIS